jgi:hypothetical protein
MTAKVHAYQTVLGGKLALRLEEAAMRHEPMEQDERLPNTFFEEGDPDTVRCREMIQATPPAERASAASAATFVTHYES